MAQSVIDFQVRPIRIRVSYKNGQCLSVDVEPRCPVGELLLHCILNKPAHIKGTQRKAASQIIITADPLTFARPGSLHQITKPVPVALLARSAARAVAHGRLPHVLLPRPGTISCALRRTTHTLKLQWFMADSLLG
jgi:hypothetical protein